MDYHYVFTLAARYGPATADGVITFRPGTTHAERYRAAREHAIKQANDDGAEVSAPGVVMFYTLLPNA